MSVNLRKLFSILIAVIFLILLVKYLPFQLTNQPLQVTGEARSSSLFSPLPTTTNTPQTLPTPLTPEDTPYSIPAATLVPNSEPTATSEPYVGLVVDKIEPVANGPYLSMLWSPDRKQLLVSRQASTYKLLDSASQKSSNGSLAEMQDIVSGVNDLWLVDVGTAKEQKILDRTSTYAWSPDGKKFVYIQPVNNEGLAGEVHIYNLEDGTSSLLTKADFLGTAYTYSIQWLATNEIIFVRDWQLWSIRPDGSTLRRIPGYIFIGYLLSSVVESTELAHNEKSSLRLMSFQFSRDGNHFAFITNHQEFDTIARKLYIANADGSGQYSVTDQAEGSYHEWSPDSKWVVFNTFRGIDDQTLDRRDSGHQGLWVVSADGKEKFPVLQRNDWYSLVTPIWSLDSTKIAFIVVSPQLDAGNKREIWIGNIPNSVTTAPLRGSNEQNEDIRLIWWGADSQSMFRLSVNSSNMYAMDRILLR